MQRGLSLLDCEGDDVVQDKGEPSALADPLGQPERSRRYWDRSEGCGERVKNAQAYSRQNLVEDGVFKQI